MSKKRFYSFRENGGSCDLVDNRIAVNRRYCLRSKGDENSS
jgi:hypothetical protein